MEPNPTADAPRRPRAQRPHDPAATRLLITDAAVRLLADKGFPGLGVNSLAAAAGVDKQLIYYHFGGLEGVVRELSARLQGWLGEPLPARAGETYAAAMQRMLLAYARVLRQDTLVLRLLAWELVQPSPTLELLETTRSDAMVGWAHGLRARAGTPPAGLDTPAVNALLMAGLQHLALRAESVGSFAGLDLKTPESAARIDGALQLLLQRVYGQPR